MPQSNRAARRRKQGAQRAPSEQPPPVAEPFGKRTYGYLFWLIASAALALRAYHLGRQELWYDEVISFHMAVMPEWWHSARLGAHPPLYYVLLRAWTAAFGPSEVSLRTLSAGLGTVSIMAIMVLGKAVFTREVGLWAGAFAALAPMHLYYSQEVRNYTLVMLLITVAYWSLWHALARGGRWWLGALASMVAVVSTHLLGLLALLPTAILLRLWPDRAAAKRALVPYVSIAATVGMTSLAWLLWIQPWSAPHTADTAFQQGFWDEGPRGLMIPKSLEVLGLGSHQGLLPIFFKQLSLWVPFPLGLRVLGLGALGTLAVVALVPWQDDALKVPWLHRRKAWIFAALLLPLALLWGLSFYRPIYLPGRYDMIVFPFFALVVGLGFAKTRAWPRGGAIAALVLAAGLSYAIGFKLWFYYGSPNWGSGRRVAAFLNENLRDSDVVVLTGGSHGLPFLYYLYRLGYADGYCRKPETTLDCRFFPPGHHEHRFLDPRQAPTPQLNVERLIDEYAASARDRIWVILPGENRLSPTGQLEITPQEQELLHGLESAGFTNIMNHETLPWVILLRRPEAMNGPG